MKHRAASLRQQSYLLPRDVMHKRDLYGLATSCGVRPSVYPSLTFVYSVSKWVNISNFFSSSGSYTILVYPYQALWQYSDENPSNRSVDRCRWGMKNRYFWLMSRFIACCQRSDRHVLYTQCRRTVASWWHSSLVAAAAFLDRGRRTTKCLWQEASTLRRDNRTELVWRW